MPITPITPMTPPQRAGVHALLRQHRLPLDGFDEAHVRALVATDGDRVVGSAAIERYGQVGLLRSVAVADAHRGLGLGTELTHAAIALAQTLGLTHLYLLTETASGFFPRFGFVPVSRGQVPEAVQASVEFAAACPASAQAFELSLTGVTHER